MPANLICSPCHRCSTSGVEMLINGNKQTCSVCWGWGYLIADVAKEPSPFTLRYQPCPYGGCGSFIMAINGHPFTAFMDIDESLELASKVATAIGADLDAMRNEANNV